MKPWAKLEQNYINHPKFLALSSNAICLWLEGKNYCDMHQTDGLIPREALKTFRFSSDKSLGLLLRSCGLKPNNEPYAPLWEPHPVGFKMHDYLEHNDCRDDVLARMQKADAERDRKKKNQKEYRDRQKLSDVAGDVTGHAAGNGDREKESPLPDKQKQQQQQQQKQEDQENGARAEDRFENPVVAAYRSEWSKLYGHSSSLITSPLEDVKLFQHTEAHSIPKLIAAVRAYFLTGDDYIRTRKHPWPLFLRDPLTYLAKASAKPSREDEAAAILAIVKRQDAGDYSS